VTEVRKDATSNIPKLLELNLEESWRDVGADAMKLHHDETRGKIDSGRSRGETGRIDDRPPAKKMKDEPSSYGNQRDDGYGRDRTRGGRGRGKADMSRSGAARGSRSSANDYRYTQGRDNVVSEYQPGRGEKRGTLMFERSDLHSERQMPLESKRGQLRFSDAGSRQAREDRYRDGRSKDGRENSTKKAERISTNKPSDSQSTSQAVASSTSGAFTTGSDREPVRTNAWNQPLNPTKQSSELTRSDEIPDVSQWTTGNEPLLDSQQDGSTDKDALSKNSAGSLSQTGEKAEIDFRLVESRGYDRESGRQAGFRAEGSRGDYRSDRGRRQSRRGRRQNWSDLTEDGENVPRYSRRSRPRANKDGRGPRTTDDVNEEADDATSRQDQNRSEGRRTGSRYSSGGRSLRQSGHGEYSVRSRGRGVLRFYLSLLLQLVAHVHTTSYLHPSASVAKPYNLVLAKGADLFGWESNSGPSGE